MKSRSIKKRKNRYYSCALSKADLRVGLMVRFTVTVLINLKSFLKSSLSNYILVLLSYK